MTLPSRRAELPAGGSPAPGSARDIPESGRAGSPRAADPRGRWRRFAAPVPGPDTVLEMRAREIRERVAAGLAPAHWRLPGFAADLDQVRRQLRPLSTRDMLAASYDREGEHLATLRRLAADPTRPPPAAGAMDLAYAIRWMELGPPGGSLPAWLAILDGVPAEPGEPGG